MFLYYVVRLNNTDDDILTLIGAKNKEVMEENANKNEVVTKKDWTKKKNIT